MRLGCLITIHANRLLSRGCALRRIAQLLTMDCQANGWAEYGLTLRIQFMRLCGWPSLPDMAKARH